jgi:hypothetical protein
MASFFEGGGSLGGNMFGGIADAAQGVTRAAGNSV